MRKAFFILFLSFTLPVAAQNMTVEQYIKTYKDAAIKNMQLKKVPASITLAQGILESGNGNSNLAKFANNHFGIKCHSDWTGEKYYQDDDAPNECFRKYKTVLDSYEAHADFLIGRERYKSLFSLEITDYKGWARGLKAAGYATNPTYADQLISLIERYQLFNYDKEALLNSTPIVTSTDLPPNTTTTTIPTTSSPNTTIVHINGLRGVIVGKGQTKSKIALDFDVSVKQIEKYNELGPGDELVEGQLIFVEPKRTTAEHGTDYHIIKTGETIYSIAQQYGIKTDALLKKNNMWYASQLKVGDRLYLRKKKPM